MTFEFYSKGFEYFESSVSDSFFVEILDTTVADLKRILYSTYPNVSDMHKENIKTVSNHFTGVYLNILMKAYEGIVKKECFKDRLFSEYLKVETLSSGELIAIYFFPIKFFEGNTSVIRLVDIFREAMNEVSIESVAASKKPESPYKKYEKEPSVIYNELIYENL